MEAMSEEQFNEIATRERGQLMKSALGMLGDEELAADAVQEALVNLWLFRDRMDTNRPASPLLSTILRNICLMYLRNRKRRQPHIGLESIPPSQLHIAVTASDNPQQDLEARERAEAVRQALARLSPPHQAVLQMHYSAGLSIQQIANIRNATTAAVKQMLLRARTALRTEIERRNP